jgi:arabinogalactan endo-1,4-beta-galactosidase
MMLALILAQGCLAYQSLTASSATGGSQPVNPKRFAALSSLTALPGANQVEVRWDAQAGATNYVVERALDSGGPYQRIGFAGATTNFFDRVVSYGMTYYYIVAAVSSGTNGGFAGPVTAVPVSAYPLSAGPPFAKGADVSSLSQMEAGGYTWLGRTGTPQDIFQILTNFGLNAVRFRVWVTNLVSNPGAWNNQADVIAKAVRAKNDGLRIMIDFHYSDTWADPGTQDIPAAWTNYSTAQLIAAVSNHTYTVLSALRAAGVTAEWVQVGNEISCGMLWTNGNTCADNYQTTLAAMLNSGYAAVKAANPATRVVLHLNHGQQSSQWWFDPMVNLGVQFDVIGLSVYPTTTTNWIADTTNAQNNMLLCSARYGKEVDISETGMDVTAATACESMLVDLMNRTAGLPGHRGLGLFYWEPATAYWGQGAYLFSGKVGSPTVAMNAFLATVDEPPAGPVLTGALVAGPTAAGQIALSWPGWASNYAAAMTTNLGLPDWRPVTNPPQSSNGWFHLYLPAAPGPPQFFRLSAP